MAQMLMPKDNDGNSPLHGASNKRHVEVAEVLLANDADVNTKDFDGNTPLHVISNDLVSRLFHREIYGDIQLHYVSSGKVAKLLIDHGADIHTKNKFGNTPLHLATFNGHVEVTEVLITNGADFIVRNDKDETPLDYAKGGLKQPVYAIYDPIYE